MNISRRILPIIVFSQFCCTSLWFAGNAVIANLVTHFQLQPQALGHLISAVQLGFITGTLILFLGNVSPLADMRLPRTLRLLDTQRLVPETLLKKK